MTSPVAPTSGQPGTTTTGGILGGAPAAPGGPGATPSAANNKRPNSSFPTLNPPKMNTAVYAPDVTIIVEHNGTPYDISKDIVRGQIVRKENAASSLFVTLANPNLRYTSGDGQFSRMDRIVGYLTRTTRIQVFSGYIDKIPWMQAYPGTVDIRATCTLKRLLHTWWNPALPQSMLLFDQINASPQSSDDGLTAILQDLMTKVGNWPANTVHIQAFPMRFITFLNNYFLTSNIQATNHQRAEDFAKLLLGDDTSPGPGAAVGYQASDAVGSAAGATNAGPQFYLQQIVQACDDRGMGPVVDVTANSQTVTNTADIFESAPTADPQTAPTVQAIHSAGQDLAQYSSNWQAQNAASDAAILAVAAATIESNMTEQANNADPTTLTFYYDSLSTNGTSAGLFGMPNNGSWGTAAQRMNPLASAGMFLDKLNSITGWRNMDDGQAIWLVLQSANSQITKYDGAIPAATKLVQAYRQATQGANNAATSALGAVPGAGALTGLLGGGANPISNVTGAIGGATTSPVSAASGAAQTGRPVPDSEGAINAAMTFLGAPFQEGGDSHAGLDSGGLVQVAFNSIGFSIQNGPNWLRDNVPPVPVGSAARGDILLADYGGQAGISLGDGTWLNASGPGPASVAPIPQGAGGVVWAGRMCQNGGMDPGAVFTPGVTGSTAGTGLPPGTGTGATSGGGGGSTTGSEPIARNLFSYIFRPTNYAMAFADYLTGEESYIDAQPLIQMVRALCTASLRSFQSAPNGDFMAYYPDYFGLDGKPAILALEDIELKDCHIDLSDDNLTTHVYIEGDYTMMGMADQTYGWLNTCGVATVENTQLYQSIIQAAPGDVDQNMSAQQLMSRFGVRPYRDSYSIAGNSALEFLLAVQIFMGKWASQYETDIGMTFMPELYPGMRVLMVGHNLTVYCSAVTHEFDWEHGFSTTATVSAAANAAGASAILSSAPGFLNPVSTNPLGGGNTSNTGAGVLGSLITSGGGFAGATPGSPITQLGESAGLGQQLFGGGG